jgi:hypothetical protein
LISSDDKETVARNTLFSVSFWQRHCGPISTMQQ